LVLDLEGSSVLEVAATSESVLSLSFSRRDDFDLLVDSPLRVTPERSDAGLTGTDFRLEAPGEPKDVGDIAS
jgi:hypothetical protein